MRLACRWRDLETELIAVFQGPKRAMAVIKWKNGLRDVPLRQLSFRPKHPRQPKPIVVIVEPQTVGLPN